MENIELTDALLPPLPLIPVPRDNPGAVEDAVDDDKLLLFPDPTAKDDIELVGNPAEE